ncbi:MAG TPA: polysaccharide deacetylase family protein [Candidatus Polarisedimenticolaceae bacterium]|nr:polysaccharide deacetylase family protein [Candidatus Polarisedimenticolaceae bacterium]
MIATLLLSLSMAVTFDDLPAQGFERGPAAVEHDINKKIVVTVKKRRIPAVAFVNEQGLETDGKVDPKKVASLTIWLDAGLELGNHTYSHPSLHKVPLEQYLREIADGERVTKPLAAERGRHYGWFRHPYLQTGRSLETKHAVEAYLADHGYRVAPVTIDNSEWVFARAYAATKDAATKKKIGSEYLDYMMRVVAYYEKQSELLFGRQIPQVLLVHANSLNAEYFDDLADRIAARGYCWITLGDAVADEAYRSADEFIGNGGITWLHRWALTRGGKELIVPDEPTVPEWVEKTGE